MRHCNYAILTGIIRVPPIGSCQDLSGPISVTCPRRVMFEDLVYEHAAVVVACAHFFDARVRCMHAYNNPHVSASTATCVRPDILAMKLALYMAGSRRRRSLGYRVPVPSRVPIFASWCRACVPRPPSPLPCFPPPLLLPLRLTAPPRPPPPPNVRSPSTMHLAEGRRAHCWLPDWLSLVGVPVRASRGC